MTTHIGELIRQKIREDGRTAKTICEEMDMSRGNLDKIYHKESLNSDLLARFSEVLNYDFFQHVNPFKYQTVRKNSIFGTEEPHASYGDCALELKNCKEELRHIERELSYMDQSLQDLKSSLRDKDDIIGLQKDKLALMEALLNTRKGK